MVRYLQGKESYQEIRARSSKQIATRMLTPLQESNEVKLKGLWRCRESKAYRSACHCAKDSK